MSNTSTPLLPSKVKSKGGSALTFQEVLRSSFILISELCERLTYYSIVACIQIFLLRIGFTANQSTNISYYWSSLCYVTPLIGAYLADSFLGRFRAILIFTIVYSFGMF